MEIKPWSPSVEGMEQARKHLGRRLREGRERAGLSQAEAAKVAAVSQPTFARFEAGTAVIGYRELRSLAERYGCRMMELCVNEQYPSAPRDPARRLEWVRERNRLIQSSTRDLTLHGKG